jgi:hypothetical protein
MADVGTPKLNASVLILSMTCSMDRYELANSVIAHLSLTIDFPVISSFQDNFMDVLGLFVFKVRQTAFIRHF